MRPRPPGPTRSGGPEAVRCPGASACDLCESSRTGRGAAIAQRDHRRRRSSRIVILAVPGAPALARAVVGPLDSLAAGA